MKKIRLGIYGCGSVSNSYLPQIMKSPYIELVSACDIITERVQTLASKYSVPNQFTRIEDMLKGPKFDLFLDFANMQVHGSANRLALEAGFNVWSEKPLANTYEEGYALLQLAKSKGVRVWGAPAVVSSPQFEFMLKTIRAGKLGSLAAATSRYGHQGPEWSSFWYEEGGGSMPDLGVYNMTSLTGLLGPVKSLTAMTTIVTPVRITPDKGKIPVVAEDNAMVIMNHGNGILSHVMCGFNYFDPYGHEGKGQDKPTISIFGSKGYMHLIGYDWEPSAVELSTEEDPMPKKFATDDKGYVWESGVNIISEFLATGKVPLITVEHSLHVLEIIQAARESQKTGKHVELKSTFKPITFPE